MPVDPELLDMFNETVMIEAYLGKNFDNVPQYAAAAPYQCKIDAKTEEVLRRTGDTAVSTHRVVLTDNYQIDERSRITMPTRFRIASPEIMAVRDWTEPGFGPLHHTTLMVGARKGASA